MGTQDPEWKPPIPSNPLTQVCHVRAAEGGATRSIQRAGRAQPRGPGRLPSCPRRPAPGGTPAAPPARGQSGRTQAAIRRPLLVKTAVIESMRPSRATRRCPISSMRPLAVTLCGPSPSTRCTPSGNGRQGSPSPKRPLVNGTHHRPAPATCHRPATPLATYLATFRHLRSQPSPNDRTAGVGTREEGVRKESMWKREWKLEWTEEGEGSNP